MKDVGVEKALLRKALLERRAAVSGKREKDKAILNRVLVLPEYLWAKRVFLYVSARGEVDTRGLLEAALAQGRQVFAPVCGEKEGAMGFYRVKSPGELRPGRWGILEPDPEKAESAPAYRGAADELMVTPGVAFDRRGFRLGYGKGYYDRFLAGREGTTLGLCYEELLLERLLAEEHDQRVKLIATETGLWRPERTVWL